MVIICNDSHHHEYLERTPQKSDNNSENGFDLSNISMDIVTKYGWLTYKFLQYILIP